MRHAPLVLLALVALPLGGCLGPAPWDDWESASGSPASAPSASLDGGATGAIPNSAAGSVTYDRWTPIETAGTAPLAPLETAPLDAPPGTSAPETRAAGAGEEPASVRGPYTAGFTQHTVPLTITGLGARAVPPQGGPAFRIVQRTLPLIVTGTATGSPE